MIASPINPSDLLLVRGQYGRQPPLPATPGFEGVGVVESGSGLLARRVMGRRVAVLNSGNGNWKEHVVIPARQAVPIPKELSDEQAATFFINPASALVMTRYVLKVPAGAWLLQTAAASTLGRMVIRLGQRFGFRTLNVVRRSEQAEELLRLGGTAAIATNDESLTEKVQAATGGDGVRFALDAVGGMTGSEVVRTLGRGGRMLAYGTLAGEPLSLDPRADDRPETGRGLLAIGVGARSEAVDDAVAVSEDWQTHPRRRARLGSGSELSADGHPRRRPPGGAARTTGEGTAANDDKLRPNRAATVRERRKPHSLTVAARTAS